ncbi:hypothetical protein FF011L_38350 [Roseimaritima multifibrata]|uniref:Uncharacterized protein n=1 Tax=Roseimaritima multifibrata TaxID=1930274 RepID=A0A517MJH7_9BACT|nr:hypothetical protein [Roseimaritima multifibrata]QDS95051.1 hypothetical protein FF011L_38350 [Roseimaritima multifibrata]
MRTTIANPAGFIPGITDQAKAGRRWQRTLAVAALFAVVSGCSFGKPATPPGIPQADGSFSYQAGPEHPLVQQANAIRQTTQTAKNIPGS